VADVVTTTDDGRAAAGSLALRYATGASARVDVDWDAPVKRRTITVHGTRGSLHWDDLAAEPVLMTTDGSRRVALTLPAPREPLSAVAR
jgi:hypothetical protein